MAQTKSPDRDLLDLDGQAAFVTGAGQGAGRGIAMLLARLNALLTSQSFLVIAYASNMAIANDRWSR